MGGGVDADFYVGGGRLWEFVTGTARTRIPKRFFFFGGGEVP